MKRKFINIDKWVIPLITAITLIVIWELIVQTFEVYEYILPAPSVIFNTLVINLPIMWRHITSTLLIAIVGFGISILIAILVSAVVDSLPFIKKAIYPFIILSQTIPIIFIRLAFSPNSNIPRPTIDDSL